MVKASKRVFGILFVLVGAFVSLGLISLGGTTMISNKLDSKTMQAANIFCTFERIPFSVKNVVSDATGESVMRLDTLLIGLPIEWYTYNVSQTEIVDVGLLNTTWGSVLALSSESLKNSTDYVVDYGTIITLHEYGNPGITQYAVRIERVHERNWFDDFVVKNLRYIVPLFGFGIVIACSLIALPFAEHLTNTVIKGRKS